MKCKTKRFSVVGFTSYLIFFHVCFLTLLLYFRFSIDLDKSRELEIGVYWRDWRSLCAIKFLRLEDFIDDIRHGMALQLEPQGLLFAEVIMSIC